MQFAQHQERVLKDEKGVTVRLHYEIAVKPAIDDRSATRKARLESMILSKALKQSEGCCHFGHGGWMDGAVFSLGDKDGPVFRLDKNALIGPEMGGCQWLQFVRPSQSGVERNEENANEIEPDNGHVPQASVHDPATWSAERKPHLGALIKTVQLGGVTALGGRATI